MKFKNYIETESGIKDTSTSPGTAGQVLSSTVTGTSWIDQNTISSGTSEVVDIQVKNISSPNGGINLSKGDPVYIYGSVGASARLYVDLADADSTATNNLGDSKMPCVALLDQDLAPNIEGTATVVGKLRNLITNPIDGDVPNENDTVYVKSGGGLTLTKPTGSTNLIQNVGQVGRVSTSSDGNIVVAALLRSNDVPNLPEGRLFVGTAANTSLTSDVIYVDDTSEWMGIGTTTNPSGSKLTIQGGGFNMFADGGTGADVFKVVTHEYKLSDENEDLVYLYDNATGHQFSTQGNPRVTINSAGNVGIGTTDPQVKLHVANGTLRTWTPTSGTSAIFESTVSNRNFLTLTATNEAELWFGDATTQAKGRIRYEIRNSLVNLERMEFWTNSTQKMVIDGSGNVGIGAENPGEKLHVSGSGGVRLQVESTDSYDAALKLTNTAGSYGSFVNSSGSLNVYDYNASDTRTTLLANGNFGIGTTNPGSKLEVDGEIDASGSDGYRINGKPWAEESSNNLRLGDWDGEGFSTSICDDNSAVVVTVKDYGAMINCSSLTSSYGADASLAVGLGTGGAAVLTLSNTDANPSNAGDSTGIIQFAIKDDNSNLGYTSASIQGSISQAAGSGNGGGGVLDFLTAPAISGSSPQTRMRIKDSGNVGIGTTNPSSILHLEDTTPTLKILSNQYYNNSAISMGNGQSEAAFITCSNNPGISNLELRYDNGSTGDGRIRVGQRNLDFMIDAVSAMYINSSKNVGIGTTFPSEKLTVGGNISIASPNSFLVKNGDSNHGLKYGYNTFASNPTDGPILYGYDAGGLGTKRSSENIALYWNYLGNVGIGTTDPNHELVVEGASSPNIELKNTSYSNGGFVLNRANYTQQWKWWAESSQMYFGFSTDESTYSNKLLIKSNGNVGIGATNPSEKLDVVGNIKVSGDQYFNGAAIYGDNKEIIRYSDTWLRINPANNFTNGIYCGSGILRTDGIFQVGPSGSKFVVNSIGNVGINGTPSTTTSTKLKVYGTITSTGGSGFQIENGYGNPRLGDFYGSFTTTHPLYVGSPYSGLACHASAFNITSDYRLKENEALLTEASSRIKKLKPIRFNYINSENTVDGFLAHEVAEVIPEAVTGEKDAIREDGSDELQGLDLSKIVPLLTAALQESITKIEKLEQRIQTLENK